MCRTLILVLGGTRYFGIPMGKELLARGHDVTIATRGNAEDGFGDKVQRIIVERTDAGSMKRAFAGQYYDVVIDKIAYCSNDIKYAMEALKFGKYIYMSSTSAYEPKRINTKEIEFDGIHRKMDCCLLSFCRRYGFIMKLNKELSEIMEERFGKDTVIALATINQGLPYVRNVNAYYENGAFYIITHACSNKMKHIEKESTVAIAGEWFTAHGKGDNLGFFGNDENRGIAEKLRTVFEEWIDNGHNDFEDENTIILCIRLMDGVLLSHGTAYNIEF